MTCYHKLALTRQAVYVHSNSEVLSCNRGCSKKKSNITYSECMFLVLGIQHVERVRRVVRRLWPVRLYNIFLHDLTKGTIL